MIAVHLDHIQFAYGHETLFTDLVWQIHADRRVGLIGSNGCGKSTLLNIIAGQIECDDGFVIRKDGLSIGVLNQHPDLDPDASIWDAVITASQQIAELEQEMQTVDERLADPQVYGNSKTLVRVLAQQENLLAKYTQIGGPSYEGRIRSVLQKLGFNESQFSQPIHELSGGQKKLVGLARLMVMNPDLLLLDEPDNHLDLEGKAYLEAFLLQHKGAVILVSHDRYLLDLVVDEIVEMEAGQLTHYPGEYSTYMFEKQARLQRQEQVFQAQQKEIKRLEQAAQRMLTWGAVYDNEKFSRRGKAMLKRLDKMERVEQPLAEQRRMGLNLSGWRGSQKVLELIDLDMAFRAEEEAQLILFTALNLQIWHGERVGLVGPNGAGKTVLFSLILGELEASGGRIVQGPSVRAGYFAQEHETLDMSATLIDTVRQAKPLSETAAVAFLNRFLFTYEQVRNPIRTLSGGERSRLQIALLMLSDANFLLLDEPTNNLDIASAETLEAALAEFEGSALIISHDRYFLDQVVDRIIELEYGSLREYTGAYSAYQAAKLLATAPHGFPEARNHK